MPKTSLDRLALWIAASLAAVTLLGLLALAPAALGAWQTVARVDTDTPISAYGGLLAFSQRDPATGMFKLMIDRDGTITPAPVAARKMPFDVDLAPDAQGQTVAVYSRCTSEPPALSEPPYTGPPYSRMRDCRVYELNLSTNTETQIASTNAPGASQFDPTIWGTRIAFARIYANRPDYPYLYTRQLTHGRASVRLPGGPRAACQRSPRTHRQTCADPKRSMPLALDLHGQRLAFAWSYTAFGEGPAHDLLLDTIGKGQRLIDHSGSGGLTTTFPDWPTFEAGYLYYDTACFGDPEGCPQRHHLDRYQYTTSQHSTAPAPAAVLWATRGGGTTYLLTGPNASSSSCTTSPPSQTPGCQILASTPGYRP